MSKSIGLGNELKFSIYNCCNSIKYLTNVKQVANVGSEQIDIGSNEPIEDDESSR
jgi:hypothetical protein